tara:strand:+ start:714 stop:1499 length:786 start_codon:yes stop_codon:yes gene_type:complete
MAFAFEIQPTVVGFNLDNAEEVILIHHFEMAESLNPNDQILLDFKTKFFEDGKGVSEIDFEHIIELAKRVSSECKGLSLKPSGRTDYMQTRDKAKSALRIETRAKLAQRAGGDTLSEAYKQLEHLPMPMQHEARAQKSLFDLYRSNSAARNQTAPLSVEERERRRQALETHTQNNESLPSAPTGGEQPDMSDVDVLSHMGGNFVEENRPYPQPQIPPTNSEVLRMVQGDITSMQNMLERLVKQVDELTREIHDMRTNARSR